MTETSREVLDLLTPILAPLGYRPIAVEVLNLTKAKKLRVFIDHEPESATAIGIEDCVKVTKTLDVALDQIPRIDAIFKGAYELEVSSPGVERPLFVEQDYVRFVGKRARIHTFRPLTRDELENTTYQEKNPKQKNFLGLLNGLTGDKIQLAIPVSADRVERVAIPCSLVTKAHLDPEVLQEKLKGK
jgi:ribosome maturation factor RimP